MEKEVKEEALFFEKAKFSNLKVNTIQLLIQLEHWEIQLSVWYISSIRQKQGLRTYEEKELRVASRVSHPWHYKAQIVRETNEVTLQLILKLHIVSKKSYKTQNSPSTTD